MKKWFAPLLILAVIAGCAKKSDEIPKPVEVPKMESFLLRPGVIFFDPRIQSETLTKKPLEELKGGVFFATTDTAELKLAVVYVPGKCAGKTPISQLPNSGIVRYLVGDPWQATGSSNGDQVFNNRLLREIVIGKNSRMYIDVTDSFAYPVTILGSVPFWEQNGLRFFEPWNPSGGKMMDNEYSLSDATYFTGFFATTDAAEMYQNVKYVKGACINSVFIDADELKIGHRFIFQTGDPFEFEGLVVDSVQINEDPRGDWRYEILIGQSTRHYVSIEARHRCRIKIVREIPLSKPEKE